MVGYEYGNHHLDGFSNENDDLPQHRVRASLEALLSSGWSVSTYSDAFQWDDELGFAVGLYLQKGF
jgi:hypothetical protein